MGITHQLLVFAVHLVNQLGYAGVAICLVLNAMGIPIASEIILPLAGILAKQGAFNLVAAVAVAIGAQLIGQIASYFIGAKLGMPFLHKYGRYVLLNHRELNMTHRFFERYGQVVVVAGFCLPFLRGYVGYVAGVATMSFGRYIVSAIVGTTIWSVLFIWLGYSLATNLFAIEDAVRPVTYAVLVAIAAAVAYYLYRHIQRRKA